jgi:carbamoyltransferase
VFFYFSPAEVCWHRLFIVYFNFPVMKEAIIGISAFYHDSAACLVMDGEIVAAAQEERFTRKKYDSSFPDNALQFILRDFIDKDTSIRAIAFYEKPYVKFERLLETYHAFAPMGLRSFLTSMPVWIKEKIFIKNKLKKALGKYHLENTQLLFPEHHLSHAASAFYPSPFEEAAIITVDGVGEWATTTIGKGSRNKISVIKEMNFPHSLGLLYSAFTYYCGFKVNGGEFKLMGLAPYGNRGDQETDRFVDGICRHLVDLREDGSFLLNMKYFRFGTGFEMTNNKLWEKLFGISRRQEGQEITQHHMNLAFAVQVVTDRIMIQLALTAQKLTNCSNLVMAGGVALNCVANGKIAESRIFKNIWIQPAAGDAGGAVGAALAVHHISRDKRRVLVEPDSMKGVCLGPSFHNNDVWKALGKLNAKWTYVKDFSDLSRQTAGLIHAGKVVGWFQGRMEFGPRALGNRSILADPRNPDMQKILNIKIKFREGFRPFAPAVLEEDAKNYFKAEFASPYMLFVMQICSKLRNRLPEQYEKYNLLEKLYFQRSHLPAITHIDYSARVQTVSKQSNPRFWQLLRDFKDISGYGVLINTSFNVRGEPIVCTPEEAYHDFMRTGMDYLVIGNFILDKLQQPAADEAIRNFVFAND